jgi:hypothetical protein
MSESVVVDELSFEVVVVVVVVVVVGLVVGKVVVVVVVVVVVFGMSSLNSSLKMFLLTQVYTDFR